MFSFASEQAYINLYEAAKERDLSKITRLLALYGERSSFSNVNLSDLQEQMLRGYNLQKVSDRVFTVETAGLLIITLTVCHDTGDKVRYSLTIHMR